MQDKATANVGSVARWLCKLCVIRRVKKAVAGRVEDRSYEGLSAAVKDYLDENPPKKKILENAGYVFGNDVTTLVNMIY